MNIITPKNFIKNKAFYSLFLSLCLSHFAYANTSNQIAQTDAASVSDDLSDSSLFIEKHLENVELLESTEGAYGENLSQALFALGQAYRQSGKREQAIKTLKRSLHLKRVNEGLYTISQVPIIENLIDVLAQSQQWNSVAKQFAYLNWLHQQNYTADDIEMIAMKMKLANWHLKSYSLSRLNEPAADLVDSYYAYSDALTLIEQTYGPSDLKLIAPLHGVILANYLVAITTVRDAGVAVLSDGQVVKTPSALTMEVNTLKNKNLSRGIALIKRELDIYLAQPAIDHMQVTRTKLKLADWYFMYGRRNKAKLSYQEAYQYLADNGGSEAIIDKVFSQPVALPDFPNLNNHTSTARADLMASKDKNFVLASLDVTQFGKAKNIKIVSSNLENDDMHSKIIRSLKNTKFRPRIVQGNVISTEQMKLRVFP